MDTDAKVITFVSLVQKIYNQGELNPFIELVQSSSRIILFLAENPNAHPSEISDALNMSRPNVTANLKSLEQNKIISRKLNPDNRREIYVSLTDAGFKVFEERIKKVINLFQDWINLLGPVESEHLIKILEISSDMENVGQRFKNYNCKH